MRTLRIRAYHEMLRGGVAGEGGLWGTVQRTRWGEVEEMAILGCRACVENRNLGDSVENR